MFFSVIPGTQMETYIQPGGLEGISSVTQAFV